MRNNATLTLNTVYAQLAPIDRVRELLAQESDVQAVAEFDAKAQAAKALAGRDRGNAERRNYYAKLANWSSVRLGELIDQGQQEGWIDNGRGGNRKSPSHDVTLKIDEVCPNRQYAHRCRHLADVQALIDEYHAEADESGAEITKAGAIAYARRVRAEQINADLDEIAAREPIPPDGLYDVIVIDPPWAMEKIERDVTPNQVAFDYPTMDQADLLALDVPMADECHVWLWATQRFLRDAFDLLDGWGLKYICEFIWHKPGGFQPFGLPQYNAEFALYARKGSPTFKDVSDFPVCFSAPRGRHSEKPYEFYEMVRRATSGRRLDMFNRREIDGFVGWGNEAPSRELWRGGTGATRA